MSAGSGAGRRRNRFSRRAGAGALVVAGWLVALGFIVRRDGSVDPVTQLATAGARVAPGSESYVLEQSGAQIGYASSTIDTTTGGVSVTDFVAADLPVGGKLNRVTARLRTEVTRSLGLRAFDLRVDSPAGALRVTGEPVADSVLVLAVSSSGAPADTQRVAIRGPVLLPSVIPLALALGARPEVGREHAFTTFDPLTLSARELRLTVRAESLFVVSDSAALDAATNRWASARTDTVRAWRISADSAGPFAAWVDAAGRIVQLEQAGGFTLRRAAYELGQGNWKLAAAARARRPGDADILESTAIGASAPIRSGLLSRLRVRLSNVDLDQFEVEGERQHLRGDTLTVTRDSVASLSPGYTLPATAALRSRFARELAAESFLQSDAPEIRALAARLGSGSADPVEVARRIGRWVHDSLRKDITIGVPNATQVLRARSGDCNEHTQLYLALARAAGVPARGAAGLARVGSKFYYHAWPEVYLGRWVAVDPTFGEFPADAGHLRFVTGGLGRQVELLRLIGTLKIDVVDSR